MLCAVNINFLRPKSSPPPAIYAGTWRHFRKSAAALPEWAGSGFTMYGIAGRSWIQSPRPGIQRQRQAP